MKQKYKIAKDAIGDKYIRLYMDDEKLDGISEVNVIFDPSFKRVMAGNLYSYQRLKRDKEKAYDSGWGDGYGEGLSDGENGFDAGFKEGYAKAIEDIAEKERQKALEKAQARQTVKGKEGRKSSLTDAQKAEIRVKKSQGASLRSLAKEFKVSYQTIANAIKG